MKRLLFLHLLLLWALFVFDSTGMLSARELSVGVSQIVITPDQPMWMAGYASRREPSEGAAQELFAKAITFEDEPGQRFVMITTDLLGLPRSLVVDLAQRALKAFQLPRENLMVTFSHTHCGPVLSGDRLIDMYGLDTEQRRRVDVYTAQLSEKLLPLISESFSNLEPCGVAWGVGRATFAMNRRQYSTNGVIGGINPIGPVDGDVPVLQVRRPNGSVKAIVHGYACHNTTLDFQKFCGDYAGYSQAYLEKRQPGAVVLFVAGCGADANPYPRRSLELAQQYGEELGSAVLATLRQPLARVQGPIRAAFREIPLALSPPPERSEIERQGSSPNIYEQRRARRLLQTLDERGSLPTSYPYPVQFWRFGDSLQIPVLAGEVVADYSLRLKYELGRDRTWVIGYANDFVAYIPSLRVLREGGYEGGDSMVYFGHHGPWAPRIEEDIFACLHDLDKATR